MPLHTMQKPTDIIRNFNLPERGMGRVRQENKSGYVSWLMSSLEGLDAESPFDIVASATIAMIQEAYNDTTDRILFKLLDSDVKAEGQDAAAKPRASGVDEEAVVALIRKHSEVPVRIVVEHAVPKAAVELPKDEHRHAVFEKALRCVAAGVNLLLVGPAGAGKTTLAEQISRALSISFEFCGALDSPYKLTGFIDAQGRVVNTAFRRAYEHGGLFLFDEIDGSLPGAILAFNAALANGQADFPDGSVQRHPDFRVVAAANTYGLGADRQYVGRNQLDAASLDRFVMIEMGYDEVLERALTGNDAWFERVLAVRKAVTSAKVRAIVSPRASIDRKSHV